MKLTIVLTVYNKEAYLKSAFEALLNQENTNEEDYEVLVVNDGSTDNSATVIDEFAQRDSRIRLLTQSNQGLSMARNNGYMAAKGDYVWFVDADDIISKKSVCLLLPAMEEQPDVIPIYAKTDGIDKIRNCITIDAHTGKDVLMSRWEHCGVFWIMRKSFLMNNNLGFLPGVYHEDAEFTPRMLYYAQSVHVVPEVLYVVYRDPNSITQVPRPKRAFDCLTVAQHLNRFVKDKGEQGTPIGKVLDNNISVIINNAFSVICQNPLEEQQSFNEFFCAKQELLRPLRTSSRIKYRIEAFLFALFPGKCVHIYKMMKFFG